MAKKRHNIRKNKNTKLLKVLFIAIAVIFFWRGAWGLMDLYLFPNSPTLSFAISLLLGLGILYFTHYLTKELIGE